MSEEAAFNKKNLNGPNNGTQTFGKGGGGRAERSGREGVGFILFLEGGLDSLHRGSRGLRKKN